MTTTAELVAAFKQAYGAAPEAAVRAPGRVNLIGEHTDYNDGFCLPMAIEREVRILFRLRPDHRVVLRSRQSEIVGELALAELPGARRVGDWSDYLRGCLQVLAAAGVELVGCELLVDGDVPLGSGLSSSAALEVAGMHAFLQAAGTALPPAEIARLAQRAENTFVGTQCGILDQLASSCGVAGAALLMDCRDLSLQPAPLPPGIGIVISDTGKRRGLVDSAYNQRRAQCEAGAAALGVSHLRDVSLHDLVAADLDEVSRRRCEHVVAENGRTLAAAACLRAGDMPALGELMDASHLDLRDKFEVSCPELDCMCALARRLRGCHGSRMTGAGFGGCTVSLVDSDAIEGFTAELLAAYKRRYDLPAQVYATGAAAGAGELPLPA